MTSLFPFVLDTCLRIENIQWDITHESRWLNNAQTNQLVERQGAGIKVSTCSSRAYNVLTSQRLPSSVSSWAHRCYNGSNVHDWYDEQRVVSSVSCHLTMALIPNGQKHRFRLGGLILLKWKRVGKFWWSHRSTYHTHYLSYIWELSIASRKLSSSSTSGLPLAFRSHQAHSHIQVRLILLCSVLMDGTTRLSCPLHIG